MADFTVVSDLKCTRLELRKDADKLERDKSNMQVNKMNYEMSLLV